MGSDSDLPVMREALQVLEDFDIPAEISICSAHRTPDKAHEVAKSAKERGVKVIIAGAGGAAHLAGVMAAYTALPVIGVPIKAWSLEGADSLYSTAQMPAGIPVATVAINGARNAGLLAVQILATADEGLYSRFLDFKANMAEKVNAKAQKLTELGYKTYLENAKKEKAAV